MGAAFFLLCLAVFQPWAMDFALNDDWAYWLAARRLANENILKLTDWAPATQVVHVIWGGAWAKIFGADMGMAKVSTVGWLALSLGMLAFSLREQGLPRLETFGAGILLGVNPIVLALGLSFMSDVPYLGLGVLFLWASLRAWRSDENRWWWTAGLLGALAYLCRQIGLFLPLSVALALAIERKLSPGKALRLLAPAFGAVVLYQLWIRGWHGPTRASEMYLVHGTLAHLSDPWAFLQESWRRATGYGLYVGIAFLPWTAAVFLKKKPFGKSGDPVPAWGLFAGALFLFSSLILAVLSGGMPLFENTFHASGIGTMTLANPAEKSAGIVGWPGFYPLLTLLGTVGGAGFLVLVSAAWNQAPSGGAVRLLLLMGLLQFLPTLLGEKYFDRYTILVLPAWIGALFLAARPWKFARPVFWGLAATWGLFSFSGVHDYLAWNQSKWTLGTAAGAMGVPPERISGGLDWNAYWSYEGAMAQLRQEKPLKEIGEWEWASRVPKAALMSFCLPAGHPYLEIGRKSYRTLYSSKPGNVCLYVPRRAATKTK